MGVCAVTGAASGIGLAVKERLEADGHDVITVDIRDADLVADLSDRTQVEGAIEAIAAGPFLSRSFGGTPRNGSRSTSRRT